MRPLRHEGDVQGRDAASHALLPTLGQRRGGEPARPLRSVPAGKPRSF